MSYLGKSLSCDSKASTSLESSFLWEKNEHKEAKLGSDVDYSEWDHLEWEILPFCDKFFVLCDDLVDPTGSLELGK
jgi:hypothetical protein